MVSNDITATLMERLLIKEVRPQFQRAKMMYNQFFAKRGAAKVNARGSYIPIYLSPNPSARFGSEGMVLPPPGQEVERRMKVGYTHFAKGWEFTPDVILQQNSSEDSVLDGISARLSRYRNDIQVLFSQLMYGDGTGTMAIIDTANGAITATETANGTSNFYCATTFAGGAGFMTFGNKHLDLRGYYNIVSALGVVKTFAADGTTTVQVTALDSGGTRVYFTRLPVGASTPNLTPVTTDRVVHDGSYGYAFKGFEYHIVAQTGPYQELYRTGHPTDAAENFPQLVSKVYNAGGVPLTFGLITYVDELAVYREDDEEMRGKENLVVTSPTQYTKANMIGANLKRYTSEESTLTVGFDKIRTVKAGLWDKDVHCPEGNVYYVHKPDFRRLELFPLDYVDTMNGRNMVLAHTALGGGRRWAYDGWLGWMGEFAGLEPRNSGALINLELSGLRNYLNA